MKRTIFTAKYSFDNNKPAIEKLSPKQRVLFACDVARSVLKIFEKKFPEDKRPRQAIELAEKSVLTNEVTRKQFLQAVNNAYYAYNNAYYAANAAWAVAYAAHYAAHAAYEVAYSAGYAAWVAYYAAAKGKQKWDWIYNLYCNAYNDGKTFNPNCKTNDTIGLAKTIIENRDFALIPVLNDALQDVGCNETISPPYGLSNWFLFNLCHT